MRGLDHNMPTYTASLVPDSKRSSRPSWREHCWPTIWSSSSCRAARFLWGGRHQKPFSIASSAQLVMYGALAYLCGKWCHMESVHTGTWAIRKWVCGRISLSARSHNHLVIHRHSYIILHFTAAVQIYNACVAIDFKTLTIYLLQPREDAISQSSVSLFLIMYIIMSPKLFKPLANLTFIQPTSFLFQLKVTQASDKR